MKGIFLGSIRITSRLHKWDKAWCIGSIIETQRLILDTHAWNGLTAVFAAVQVEWLIIGEKDLLRIDSVAPERRTKENVEIYEL